MSKRPRVADFSTHFSGPVASRRLAQLGADVVKIEHPKHGDGNRQFPPYFNGEGIHHLHLNAGTRSVTLDPASPNWQKSVAAIAKWADVVIVGKQPSSARRLGIDFASLLSLNPELIYCLITGYGVAGEWADLPAHGLNMDALAGTLPLEWEGDTPEVPANYRSVGTTVAGIEAAVGIFAALYRRSMGGGGQVVHVSIWEAAHAMMWRDVATFANTGSQWPAYCDFGPRYNVYATADDTALLVCPIEKRFWERFCDALDLPGELRSRGDWSTGTDFGQEYGGERQQIAARLLTKTTDEWISILRSADVPIAPALDWREAMKSEHAIANGTMADYTYNGQKVRVPTTPVSITSAAELRGKDNAALAAAHRSKANDVTRAPYLGEHTQALFKELGIEP